MESAITGYRVYRATSTGTETLFASLGASTTNFTDNTVTNGVTYYYQVTALNSVGESARSNEASARPTAPATVPGAPTCSLKILTKSGIRVSWTVPANGGSAITGYRVYRSTSSGTETLLTSVAASATSYTDTTTTQRRRVLLPSRRGEHVRYRRDVRRSARYGPLNRPRLVVDALTHRRLTCRNRAICHAHAPMSGKFSPRELTARGIREWNAPAQRHHKRICGGTVSCCAAMDRG